MKRTFLFILICLLVNISYSQTYTFTFSTSDFSIVENESKHMIDYPASFDAICNTCDPILPSCVKNILLPPNKKVSNYTATYTTTNWLNNIDLKAMPMAFPTDGGDYISTPCTYDLKVYPDSIVRYGGDRKIDHYQYVSFVITPFVYDATTKTLSFVEQVTISINLIDKTSTDPLPTSNRLIKRIVHNSDDVDLFYSTRVPAHDVDYLIITVDSLKSSFEPLRIWKTQKGVYTKIITLEEIDVIYANQWNKQPLRIKTCIKHYCDSMGLEWVLLGGDDTIIPAVKVYAEHNNKVDSIPADLFYACFQGAFNWNANGNDTIGELFDNVDLDPEVNISRLPIRTKEQVKFYVDKLLRYERNPPLTTPSMLLCGKDLSFFETEAGYSDAQYNSDRLINEYITPYWDGNTVRFYDTDTDFPGGADYQLSTTNLTNQLNSNTYNFLHFDTHGGLDSWNIETGFYGSSNVSLLTNSNPIVILTTACHTNAFDSAEPCLSEAFIRESGGGAIAYLGSSWLGFGETDSIKLGPSLDFNAKFLKNLLTGVSHHFAQIVNLVKLSYNPHIPIIGGSNNRSLVLFINAIGDAELPIYTMIPNKFENTTLERNGRNVLVNTGDVDGCTITISNIANGGQHYSTFADTDSATFTGVPNGCTIVITKDNYIPYMIDLDCQIVNEIIDDVKIISGCEEVQIGASQMPVEITTTGSLEVHNGGVVTIENLSMEIGSELQIH